MEAFAAWLGTFIGAVLKQCAPVLAEIVAEGIRRAFSNTAEIGKAPDGLGDALRARIAERLRDKNDPPDPGRPSTTP